MSQAAGSEWTWRCWMQFTLISNFRTFARENMDFLREVGRGAESYGIVERFLLESAPEELHIDSSLRQPLVTRYMEGDQLNKGTIQRNTSLSSFHLKSPLLP